MAPGLKVLILATGAALVAGPILALGPIPQDPAYHAFADQRALYGIPNFWNVMSNILLLFSGIAGLICVLSGNCAGGLPGLKLHYAIFFVGASLIGAGSSWYHLGPDNNTLVWDRLPMTLSFMSLCAAIVGENLSVRAGRVVLWPLLAAGVASVLYWHVTEQAGSGDLRLYALVQFLPLVLLPLLMLLYQSPFTSGQPLAWMLIAYALAKVAEHYDREIFQALEVVSGHALKHVFAALAIYCYCMALQRRKLRQE